MIVGSVVHSALEKLVPQVFIDKLQYPELRDEQSRCPCRTKRGHPSQWRLFFNSVFIAIPVTACFGLKAVILAYFLAVLLSSNNLSLLTWTFLLSPPSTFTPLLISHIPSCTLMVATLPLLPLTGCTYGPTIVLAPVIFIPSIGCSCPDRSFFSISSGCSLTTNFLIRRRAAGVPVLAELRSLALETGASTTRNSASPPLTTLRSPPTPKTPLRNLSLHHRRYLRVRGGSTPRSRSWVLVSENRDSQVEILLAC